MLLLAVQANRETDKLAVAASSLKKTPDLKLRADASTGMAENAQQGASIRHSSGRIAAVPSQLIRRTRAATEHPSMPLPSSPTQRPSASKASKAALARTKSNNELLIKGSLCLLIGLGVLLSPHFITSPGMQSVVASSALVGWFSLVLGLAFISVSVWRRLARPAVLP